MPTLSCCSPVRPLARLLGLAVLCACAVAHAQSGRPIRMVVPLPPGSSNDAVARALAPPMAQILGQPVVVDNKAGGNGLIGTMEVVRAAPDGSTLLAGSNSPLAANVAFVKNLPYDLKKDITPIAGMAQTHWVLLVKPAAPLRSFADFVSYAKQRPGKVSVGYSTTAVQTQIATINKLAGVQLLAVPYKGTPATLTDVIGGTLDATLVDPGNASAQVKGGTLKALAVSSIRRNPYFPDWPAISETLPDYDFRAWNALVGPAGMARDQVTRLASAVNEALKSPDVARHYQSAGSNVMVMGPEELRRFIDAETDKWARLAKEANIQPE